jgi:hypothetical protein
MRILAVAFAIVLIALRAASAQTLPNVPASPSTVSVNASLMFYGDDTEFSNPFQTGRTILGTAGRVFLDASLNERVAIRAGVFVNQRFGSASSFDQVRPILTLVVRGSHSTFLFGTLDTVRRTAGPGPDRTGPHGLLPPVQRETLAFERPYEAGMQWLVETPRFQHDAWINWQRVASATERELFDIGVKTRTQLRPALFVRGDVHVVHQGGQLGGRDRPVADSGALAGGIEVGGPAGGLGRVSLEALALFARDVPDRSRPTQTTQGPASLYRMAVEGERWRLHAILWRASHFVKAEGDPLYQSVFRNGTRYPALRDYGEVGLTRIVPLAPGSVLEASIRWHRIEADDDWSLRLLGVARLRWRFKRV